MYFQVKALVNKKQAQNVKTEGKKMKRFSAVSLLKTFPQPQFQNLQFHATPDIRLCTRLILRGKLFDDFAAAE